MGQGGDIIAPRGNPIHSHNAAFCGITRRPTCRDLSRSISPNVRSVSSGRTRRALMFFFTKQQWLATANRRSTWSSNLSRKWPRTAGFVRRVCGRSNPKRRTKCCTFFRSFEADQIHCCGSGVALSLDRGLHASRAGCPCQPPGSGYREGRVIHARSVACALERRW